MEANAPEKIYILPHKDYSDKRIMNAFTEKENDKDIEYIRKDAFVKKACAWLENNLQGIVGGSIYIEDFRKYMEGEKVW